MSLILPLTSQFDRTTYSTLPSTNGVYIFKKGSKILYVGKSINIKARVLSHVENAKTSEKEYAIVSQSDTIEIIVTESEFYALLLESSLIQKHRPKYNVIWRDDKSYLYIKITKEEYPKIYPVRRENDGKSRYFGPFSSVSDVEDLLRLLRKAIPYCAQKKIGKKPCFYNKIHLCDPCPNYIESMENGPEKENLSRQYKGNIRKIASILSGRSESVLKDMQRDLKQAISSQDYERGIILRNKIQTLEYLTTNRSFDRRIEENYDMSKKGLTSLIQLLSKYFPAITQLNRIECYDISNLNQKDATASMVVLTQGLVDKSQYRRFKIKGLTLNSDFEMLEETITRRFRNKWPHPDILIIDGGKPQVRRVLQTLSKIDINIPTIGIAKRPDRIIVGTLDFPTIRPNRNDYGYRLVQQARDESHRFARKYHLFLRDQKIAIIK